MRLCSVCKVQEVTAAAEAYGGYECPSCANARYARKRENHPKRYIIIRLKQNAEIRGIPFNLKEEDIPDFPKFCPVLPWIELVYAVGKGRSAGSVSVDRIDNNKGYVTGNIRIISDRANHIKSDCTDQELVALGKDAQKRVKKLKIELDKPTQI